MGTAAVVVPDMGSNAWDSLTLGSSTPHLEWREHSIDVPRDSPLRFSDASLPSTGSEGSTTSIGDAGDYYLDLDPGQTSDGSLIDLRFSPVEHWNGDSAYPSNRISLKFCPSGPVLTSLTVSAGTLTPAFIGDCVKYTVPDVPYSNRTLTITAMRGARHAMAPTFMHVSQRWKPLEDSWTRTASAMATRYPSP